MSEFLKIDINLIAFLILGFIFIMAKKRLDSGDPFNQAYLKIVPVILIQLIVEAVSCLVNRQGGELYVILSYLIHILLFILSATLVWRGYILIRKLFMSNQRMSKRKQFLFQLPLLVNVIIVLLSPKYHLVFYITNENVYQRGNLYFASGIVIYFYLICIVALLIKNKTKLGKHEFTLLMIFCFLPIIGGLVQALFYGALYMWSSTAFGLVVMFSFLQQRMVHLDYLTGVWSRGSFEFYIKKRLSDYDGDKLGIIYCDIDKLKEINDDYGHFEGDLAIKTATKIFKNSIRKTDIIVRMGGDEFIIVLEGVTVDILESTLDRINKAFENYNKISNKKYELSCSFGSDILNSNFDTIEQFIHHVDILMYENKKSKKGSLS
ncbi:GGDEF domain-containing protein [Candidatus Galacturonibacter soehngenii]|uniref:GGDEF domain-containing protein n=1 Tax=Candidatus Galacturonatibacter soehngenii TaxID=2307010 RepID=A0A7V7QKY8_9FIRM|nr:GGDEF domain-containing protein [Candidatus Galacturonibacter soehngenii]KAB1438534.1 GGDEF domain-containing protein [Candidatus Galacturonibacter soehngenii]